MVSHGGEARDQIQLSLPSKAALGPVSKCCGPSPLKNVPVMKVVDLMNISCYAHTCPWVTTKWLCWSLEIGFPPSLSIHR